MVIAELRALGSTDVGTRDQLNRLAAAYEATYNYSQRAWRLCGSVPVSP